MAMDSPPRQCYLIWRHLGHLSPSSLTYSSGVWHLPSCDNQDGSQLIILIDKIVDRIATLGGYGAQG